MARPTPWDCQVENRIKMDDQVKLALADVSENRALENELNVPGCELANHHHQGVLVVSFMKCI
jgi:hypothetical protein